MGRVDLVVVVVAFPSDSIKEKVFSDYLLILPVKAWWGLLRKNLPRVWETFMPVAHSVSHS